MKRDRKEQMEQWILRSVDMSDPLVLQESQAERLKFRKFQSIDEYPEVIQDMIIVDHPINKFLLKK